ncbi:M48 family metallopeptidase [Aquihabitans daechungensis]|uniref:M48 family metallopeptidase n=1 Tax=Aquihabitans daechungensis TaxID=1052257 RepID=UPI003B9EDF99
MYDQVAQNKRRSAAIVIGFVLFTTAVIAVILWLFNLGFVGIAIAAVVAIASAWAAYWKSDEIALKMSRAVPADEHTYARLHNLVEGLCIASGLPKPRIYIIDDVAPNAFATGRNPKHAAIAVTTGLLDMMTRVELEGVLAHELSHIKNDDILVSTLAVTMVGMITLAADLSVRMMWWNGGRRGRNDQEGGAAPFLAIFGLALLVLSPLLAKLMQLSVSRSRESLADVSAIEMTRYPPGLISALEKLRDDSTVVHSASRATAHLWIEAPVARVEEEGRMSKWNRLFDTHPPLEERIAALQEL